MTNGTGPNHDAAQTSVLSFNGITVAPIQSVTVLDAGNVLVGQTGTATVTVTNNGHGNLANGGLPSTTTNLKGTIAGASSNGLSGAGSNSISLADGASSPFTYVYTPTVRNAASGGNSLAVAATFTNGNASGSNAADSATKTIRGTGAAPQDSGISGGNAGFVLVKTTRAVGITVSNANGDGNTSGKGAAGNLVNDGKVRPFDPTTPPGTPGSLKVGGNYSQTGTGSLQIAIGGTAPGTYGRLTVSGTVALAGGLDVDLVNGFLFPQGTSTYDILDYKLGSRNNLIGDFSTVSFNGKACTGGGSDAWLCGFGLSFTESFTNIGHLQLVVSETPEPGTLAILATGLLI